MGMEIEMGKDLGDGDGEGTTMIGRVIRERTCKSRSERPSQFHSSCVEETSKSGLKGSTMHIFGAFSSIFALKLAYISGVLGKPIVVKTNAKLAMVEKKSVVMENMKMQDLKI